MRDLRARAGARRWSSLLAFVAVLVLAWAEAPTVRAAPSAQVQQFMNMSPEARQRLMRQFGLSESEMREAIQSGELPPEALIAPPGQQQRQEQEEEEEDEAARTTRPATEQVFRRFLILEQLEELQPEEQPSRLADVDYAERYGLEVFESGTDAMQEVFTAPVPDRYIVGPGDEFVVSTYGTESGRQRLPVQRDGWVDVPGLGPVEVAGLPFSEAREVIRSEIESQKIGVEASITLDQLKSLQINVTGEVEKPGVYVVPSLVSVVQLLTLAGGPTDVGSLRGVRIMRNEGSRTLDLYDYILAGDRSDVVGLQPGDSIHVPAVEAAVAISGAVRRPAVYEVLPGERLADVVEMAGGLRADAARDQAILRRYDDSGRQEVLAVDLGDARDRSIEVDDGMLLQVPAGSEYKRNGVEVLGQVTVPGWRQWRPGMRLSDIFGNLSASVRLQSADLSFGYVIRREETTHDLRFQGFSVRDVVMAPGSAQDLPLEPRDTVMVFALPGLAESQSMTAVGARARRREVLSQLSSLAGAEPLEQPLAERVMEVLSREEEPRLVPRQEMLRPYMERLVAQVRDGSNIPIVTVNGEVRAPGMYPITESRSFMDMVGAAGGLTEDAHLDSAIVLRRSNPMSPTRVFEVDLTDIVEGRDSFQVAPGDVLTIRRDPQIANRLTVEIQGEVASPGEYILPAGSTLSDLIELAGGATSRADLSSAIFSRARLREMEAELRERYIAEIRKGIIDAEVAGDTRAADPAVIRLLGDLENAIQDQQGGRLQIDLPRLAAGDESADLALSDGDILTIPTFTNAVSVAGQVRAPGSFTHTAGMSVDSYLEMAGGVSAYSDEDAIFIVRANGAVDPVASSSWLAFDRGNEPLRPGDRIVVPIKYDYINRLDLTRDIVQILYQSGIGLAAVFGALNN